MSAVNDGPAQLNRLAASATNHCLTGCVLGELIRRGKGHAVVHEHHDGH